MRYVDVEFAGESFRAEILAERSPAAAAAFARALPLEGRVIQDCWGRDILPFIDDVMPPVATTDRPVYYQHPGLVMLDQSSNRLAACFGIGRLQDARGPLPAVPLAQIGGDLLAFERLGRAVQFNGATRMRFRASADQASPLPPPPPIRGRRIAITLGPARAEATLMEDTSPQTTAALADRLPAEGRATNTISSGPLTRFWNAAGGVEGTTLLEVDAKETGRHIQAHGDRVYQQIVLFPGYVYYFPSPQWGGIRICALEATVMRGPVSGGSTALVPVARLEGDWSAFRAQAAGIQVDGAKPMRIELLAP